MVAIREESDIGKTVMGSGLFWAVEGKQSS